MGSNSNLTTMGAAVRRARSLTGDKDGTAMAGGTLAGETLAGGILAGGSGLPRDFFAKIARNDGQGGAARIHKMTTATGGIMVSATAANAAQNITNATTQNATTAANAAQTTAQTAPADTAQTTATNVTDTLDTTALKEVLHDFSEANLQDLVSTDFWSDIDWLGLAKFALGYAWHIVGSLLIIIIGQFLINKFTSLVLRILQKSRLDPMLANFAVNAVKTLLYIFIILAALSNIGINTASFIAVLGAMGLAIGMAFKDTFGNIGAGVLIVFFRPFKLGDSVDVGGSFGKVVGLNLFSTHILTSDGKTIIVPNLQVIGAKIINYSLTGTRRVDVVFGISYESNIGVAKRTLQRLGERNEKVLRDPAVFVGVNALGDSSVDIVLKCWCTAADYWDVYHYLLENGKLELEAAGIDIPYPQMTLHTVTKAA